jgi:hypothetical protein
LNLLAVQVLDGVLRLRQRLLDGLLRSLSRFVFLDDAFRVLARAELRRCWPPQTSGGRVRSAAKLRQPLSPFQLRPLARCTDSLSTTAGTDS